MMAAAQQTLAAVRKHIPLIKFRKGSRPAIASSSNGHALQVQSSGKVVAASTPIQAKIPTQKVQVVEDWQIHPRYRRAPLSQEEIDYINRGGPA